MKLFSKLAVVALATFAAAQARISITLSNDSDQPEDVEVLAKAINTHCPFNVADQTSVGMPNEGQLVSALKRTIAPHKKLSLSSALKRRVNLKNGCSFGFDLSSLMISNPYVGMKGDKTEL